ncbi:cadherin-like protein 26 [Rhinophrynus dorsalis]
MGERKSIGKRSLEPDESLRPLRRSKRRWVLTTIVLEENDPGPFPKLAGDLFNDRAENLSIRYLISGPGVDELPELGLFSIDGSTGKVYVHRKIDREKTPLFVVRFDVADRETGNIVDKSLIFNVEVRDKNDNKPEFTQQTYNISVKETANLENAVLQVIAFDNDKEDTAYSDLVYSVVSQIPSLPDVTFSIDPKNGLIRGKGCLNYEKANLIKLVVRAQDSGPEPLASTATVTIHVEDGNNYLPEVPQSEYSVSVMEDQTINELIRIKVEDKDQPKTPAWRARFKIVYGNENDNYILTTDPETNEGILSIKKPLDFEGVPLKKVVISVENEVPIFSCIDSKMKALPSPKLNNVTVNIKVVDRNDAPVFYPPVLTIREKEGLKAGSVLRKMNATDPDKIPNKIRYSIVQDPAGWVTIDEDTGVITTIQELDRESPYVNKTVYTIVVNAIDDGIPSKTGSGTILLYLSDINDHTPHLVAPYMEICEQMSGQAFSVQAADKDLEPYGGPFKFELADDSKSIKDTWKIEKSLDDSVQLLMLRSLPRGNHTVPLNIYDRQGTLGKETLVVRLCACPDGQTCEKMQPPGHYMGGGAIGAIFAALLVLLVAVCLLLYVFCGSSIKNHSHFLGNEEGNQTLIHYNEEGGSALSKASPAVPPSAHVGNGNMECNIKVGSALSPSAFAGNGNTEFITKGASGNSAYGSKRQTANQSWTRNSKYMRNGSIMNKQGDVFVDRIGEMLNQRLRGFVDDTHETTTYRPRVYAYEGEMERIDSVQSFSIPDSDLDLGFLDNLDPKLARLEYICKA